MRLIDADALADALFEKRRNYPQWVADTIGGMPTVDVDALLKEQEAVEPVFVSNDPKVIGHFHCGNCHTTFGLSQYRYCPWCGRSVK